MHISIDLYEYLLVVGMFLSAIRRGIAYLHFLAMPSAEGLWQCS